MRGPRLLALSTR